jgi:methionine sulfoxide reductase heme-binding subunit
MRLSYPPFLYAAITSIFAVLLGMKFGQIPIEQALYMVRGTARVGLPLVLLIYTASAMYQLWPSALTKWSYQNRRSLGLSFAVTHTAHLLAIIYYLGQPGSVDPGPIGIFGYAMIYFMAFSSNSGSIRRLGRWWKRVHTAGVHVIWIYYLVAYMQMVFEPELCSLGLVIAPLIFAAGVVRLVAWLKIKKRPTGAAA